MKCPSCVSAELVHDTRDVPYTYKNESTVIPSVTGEFCPACGETVCVDEDLLLSEDLACPACGEKFEVDFDDVDDVVHFNGKPVDDGDDSDEE